MLRGQFSLSNEIQQLASVEYQSPDSSSSNGDHDQDSGSDEPGVSITHESFLESPQLLWHDPDPPPEKVLSLACNSMYKLPLAKVHELTRLVQTYDFAFYSEGALMQDQDLSAFLTSSDLVSNKSPADSHSCEGSSTPLPFTCRTADGSSCGCTSIDGRSGLYHPLPSESHIRLLEILPGLLGTLECILHVVPISESQNVYEALSYTWSEGMVLDQSRIRCSGVDMLVGANLASALRRLRRKAGSRLVWADAVCINQLDLGERAIQVSMMSSIFANAFQVVVWLGQENFQTFGPRPPIPLRPTYLAFSAVCSIVNNWRQATNNNSTIPEARHSMEIGEAGDEAHLSIISSSSNLWNFVFQLYRCRWFSRLWVIQEVALAKTTTVLWDDCDISWEWLGLAASIIRTNFDRISGAIRVWQDSPYFRQMPTRRVPNGITNAYFIYRLSRSQSYSSPLQLTFLDLLRLTRQFGCQDDRDRVFGLLGLPTKDQVQREIVPDYTKSLAEVYYDVATKVLDSSSSLVLLSSVQRGRDVDQWQPGNNVFNNDIPSWVPQWNVLLTQTLSPFERSASFAASGGRSLQRKQSSDPRVLIIRGIIVDRVTSMGKYDSLDYYYRGSDKANRKRRVARVSRHLHESPRTGADLKQLALALTSGQDWYGLPVQNIAAHVADYARCLLQQGLLWSLRDDAWAMDPGHTLKLSEDSGHPADKYITYEDLVGLSKGGNADRFLDAATTVCARRHRFLTSRGMIGVGPEAMERGDLVCILYGADVPFVLRPDGEGYLLVGECFISELMHDETVQLLARVPNRLQERWVEIH